MTVQSATAIDTGLGLRVRGPANPGRIVVWTLLFLGSIVMVTPFIFMISTSLKFNNEIYELSLIPREPTLENYVFLFQETQFFRWFLNSLLIATLTTVSVAGAGSPGDLRLPRQLDGVPVAADRHQLGRAVHDPGRLRTPSPANSTRIGS